MPVVGRCLRKTIPVVCLSGMVIAISGMGEPSWSAPDPSSPANQQSPAATAESPSHPGKEREGKGSHAMRKACAEDVKKFCPDVKAGEGRIARCLKQHTQDLSQGCAEMMQSRAKGRQ